MIFDRGRQGQSTNITHSSDKQKADPKPKIFSNRYHLLSKKDQQKQRHNHGQGMVEFALALPILLLLVFGVVEAGRLLFLVSSVSSASREAARYGAAVGENDAGVLRFRDCTGIRDAAKRIGAFAGVQDADVSIQYDDGPGTAVFANSCPPNEADVSLGSRIIVNVSVPYTPIVPIVPIPAFPIRSDNTHTILRSIAVGEDTGGGSTETPTLSPTETETPVETNTPTETVTPTELVTPTESATPTETAAPTPPPCEKILLSNVYNSQTNTYTVQIKKDNNSFSPKLTSIYINWSPLGSEGFITSIKLGSTFIGTVPAKPAPIEYRQTFSGYSISSKTVDLTIVFSGKVAVNKVALGFDVPCMATQ